VWNNWLRALRGRGPSGALVRLPFSRKDLKGKGLIGLTRGFMHAGARAVVASLWQVDDESTAELMRRFYRAILKGGRRPADALRAAQLELRRDQRWSAPFYWAGFVLQGDWK